MTANMSEFTRIIKRQRISGNMDTPEGGLDAMLQATVCQVGTACVSVSVLVCWCVCVGVGVCVFGGPCML